MSSPYRPAAQTGPLMRLHIIRRCPIKVNAIGPWKMRRGRRHGGSRTGSALARQSADSNFSMTRWGSGLRPMPRACSTSRGEIIASASARSIISLPPGGIRPLPSWRPPPAASHPSGRGLAAGQVATPVWRLGGDPGTIIPRPGRGLINSRGVWGEPGPTCDNPSSVASLMAHRRTTAEGDSPQKHGVQPQKMGLQLRRIRRRAGCETDFMAGSVKLEPPPQVFAQNHYSLLTSKPSDRISASALLFSTTPSRSL
jgi:hypothetical protein